MREIRFVLVSFLFLALASCSGYFYSDHSADSGEKVNKLALTGGGYISTDDYNEITPFLYREGDRAWLFFASDRGGNYDIYYAEMDSEGKFSAPVKMTNTINSSSNEISPVVYKALIPSTNTYISFIRIGGNFTNVFTAQLNTTNMIIIGNPSTFSTLNVGRISILNKTNVTSSLQAATENNTWQNYAWNSSVGWYLPNTSDISADKPIYSVDGYSGSNDQWVNFYIFDVLDSGRHQLYGGDINNIGGSVVTNFSPIFLYSSDFNDQDPCIDLETMKVYFSSDRYGLGNFDLYRYNILTYDTVVYPTYPTPPPFAWGVNATVNITNNGVPSSFSGFTFSQILPEGPFILVANSYNDFSGSFSSYFMMQLSNSVVSTGIPYTIDFDNPADCYIMGFDDYSALNTGTNWIITNGTVTFSSLANTIGAHWTGVFSGTGIQLIYTNYFMPVTNFNVPILGYFDIQRY
jgi:hypothetical protein